MDRIKAKSAIEELVKAGAMALTAHAKVRSPAQGKNPLTREEIKNCLLRGSITEGPAPDMRQTNGWRVTVTRFRAEEKHEVAAVLILEQRVLVITGYGWETNVPRRTGRIEEDDDE
ncbi:MAG: hypothetical protein HQL40_07855 [Alphaproteobacteria bacterium]|nr:hypothetical protein [Alphaproteobacteria bacterium]